MPRAQGHSMRLAKLVSFLLGLFGVAVIGLIVFVVLPGMGGHGFVWILTALLLLAYALAHVVLVAGLGMPWLLDRLAPWRRWPAFLGWLASAAPVLIMDAMLWFNHRPAA